MEPPIIQPAEVSNMEKVKPSQPPTPRKRRLTTPAAQPATIPEPPSTASRPKSAAATPTPRRSARRPSRDQTEQRPAPPPSTTGQTAPEPPATTPLTMAPTHPLMEPPRATNATRATTPQVTPRMRTLSAGEAREKLVAELLEDTLRFHHEAVEAVKSQVTDPLVRVEALAKLSQALDRTLRALGKASPELSRLAVAKELLEQFATFVQMRFPHHLPLFVEILEPFGAELIKKP